MAKIKGVFETRDVFIDGDILYPEESQRVWNHSHDGFDWGYDGRVPAQLALAILLKFTDKETAVRLHQSFNREIIAKLPQSDFEIEVNIKKWIKEEIG